MAKKKKLPDIKRDLRVLELANCVSFSLVTFSDNSIYDNKTKKMTTWQTWFKQALTDAGWKIEES